MFLTTRKPLRTVAAVAVLSAGALTAGTVGVSYAGDTMAGKIKISNAWSRATPRGAPVGAGYLQLHNMGNAADRLLSGKSDIAERVEIHSMKMTDGIMKMRHLSDGLEIPPGKMVEFKPGSYHIMFMKLKSPIVKGETFKATLVFEKSGAVDVEFTAAGIGAKAPHGKMKMKHN